MLFWYWVVLKRPPILIAEFPEAGDPGAAFGGAAPTF